jgi:hypothetical protein
MRSFSKSLAVATSALALLIAPISIDPLSSIVGSHSALADKGGGGHDGNGGGNAGGNGNGNSGGNAGASASSNGSNAGGNGVGNSFGLSTADANATNNGNNVAKTDPMHPSRLGRLNGFLNASSNALSNSSPNSAIGAVAQGYRDALSAYLGGDLNVDADDVADAIAAAANKTLTPEQVNAINERLAEENPNDPNLSGLSNPTNDPAVEAANDALAADIAARANEIQADEENQGLGQRVASFFDSVF